MDDRAPEHEPEPDRDLPSLRASDSEREATVRILERSFAEGRLTVTEFDDRAARAYAARFRDELDALTIDLSVARPHPGSLPEPRPDNAPDRRVTDGRVTDGRVTDGRVTGRPGPGSSLAIMGGVDRTGTWTVPADHTAVAVMGGIALDLRQASLEDHDTTIRAFALMGGIEILVPDDLEVEVEGIGLMGGFGEESGDWTQDPRPVRQAPPGAPRIRVTGLALMGGVGVRRVPRGEQ